MAVFCENDRSERLNIGTLLIPALEVEASSVGGAKMSRNMFGSADIDLKEYERNGKLRWEFTKLRWRDMLNSKMLSNG